MKEQIRLWFYSMLFMSVVLTGKAPYEKVVGHSTVLGEDGKKASKTDPNKKVTFDEQIEEFGADVSRYVFASANPVNDMRFGAGIVEEARRKLIAFWNICVFFTTYASIDKPDIFGWENKNKYQNIIDAWMNSVTRKYATEAQKAYDDYKAHDVIALTEKYVEDVSNFYIRVNRRRFWRNDNDDSKMNAYWVLYLVIETVAIVMVPITPFISEYIWQNIVRDVWRKAPESVMLADYPKSAPPDEELIGIVDFVKRIINRAHSLRATQNLKVKQPLRTLYVKTDKDISPFIGLIKDELNVKTVEIVADEDKFNVPHLVVDFKKAGAVLKGDVQKLKELVDKANDSGDFKPLEKYPQEFFIRKLKSKKEFISETEGDVTVVLDTTLDDELVEERQLRELIRSIQIARQEADLEITARINLKLSTKNEKMFELINKSLQKIAAEVLAEKINLTNNGKFNDAQDNEVKIEILNENKNKKTPL